MITNRKYNFISGLPRSGSTLISTILNQNPRFSAGITGPLHSFVKSKINIVNSEVGYSDIVPNNRLLDLIRSDFNTFYEKDNEVCFNTGRSWAADTSLLKQLYPNFKMIITIRSIPWILDSFERLHRKNPLQVKPLYDNIDWPSVYERSHLLMGNMSNSTARVKGPLIAVQQAAFSDEQEHILFIEYEALASHPRETMRHVYDFLEEEWYEHDFSNTEASYDEYDKRAKIGGLHTVRKEVELIPRRTILPDDLFEMYLAEDFWKHPSNPMRNCRFIHT